MRTLYILLLVPLLVFGQNFDLAAYSNFIELNRDLAADEIISRYQPDSPFFNDRNENLTVSQFFYLDSIKIKYELTADELDMLSKYHFVVSERLSFDCMGEALHDIYLKDLPIMVTTDALLYALHYSYDHILVDIEYSILEPNLIDALDKLYKNFPTLFARYNSGSAHQTALKDVDLYITIAKSLMDGQLAHSQCDNQAAVQQIWSAVQAEKAVKIPLFSERNRDLDFSQFTPRGHYTHDHWMFDHKLENYFKAMMWLGRIEFFMTAPPENPWEIPWTRDEIRRMVHACVLLDELLETAHVQELFDQNDEIITFMIDESDNLTPKEFHTVKKNTGMSVENIFDDNVLDAFQTELLAHLDYGQRIMGNMLMTDPYSPEPGQLPVSYRLAGQRFILDSYVFANVVYDRIIYQDQKIFRGLPDPLDALFVLGNDNVLPLLKEELETYKYASQLENLRYLTHAYDESFWQQSMYNTWLDCIRALNPQEQVNGTPYFMQTNAWQHLKINSQLASWAQLRHDNLLYAKQSYTAMTGCSFPHSFVEPYPEFYGNMVTFAQQGKNLIVPLLDTSRWPGSLISDYFSNLQSIAGKLETLANKELAGEVFLSNEIDWLQKMLFLDGMSGAPPFSGWYADIMYRLEFTDKGMYEGPDYLVADVHTQPTDEAGAPVGHVLHVGTGKVNLGVFLADAPSNHFQPMAYVGVAQSYYEHITNNFERLTDEKWGELVEANSLPEKPDWTNIFLTDVNGNTKSTGRELEGILYECSGVSSEPPQQFAVFSNYPNPFNPTTEIEYSVEKIGFVELQIFNTRGQLVQTLVSQTQQAGRYNVAFTATHLPSGVYIAKLATPGHSITHKMMLVK